MASLTPDTSEGPTVEVAMTGVEGFVSTGRYLGQPLAPDNGVIQRAGEMVLVHVDAHRGLISIVRAATPKYD